MVSLYPFWSRRAWLTQNSYAMAATTVLAASTPRRQQRQPLRQLLLSPRKNLTTEVRHATPWEPHVPQALALHAVDAARAAGATYTDVRVTRTVGHQYEWQSGAHRFGCETEVQGVGVRTLVDGAWGFAAAPEWTMDTVAQLARDAVAQASINARVRAKFRAFGQPAGAQRVELAPTPAVTGTWTTPIAIDPFSISVEEKLDHIQSWESCARQHGLTFPFIFESWLVFTRYEQVLATSEGTLVSQTRYESGGRVELQRALAGFQSQSMQLTGLDFAGRGWELVLDANIPEQIQALPAKMDAELAIPAKPVTLGRYTLVCDGATMAAILARTIGIATQLDRALGYEADASGTSYVTDPLAMVGTFDIAAPMVTITANRSAPGQLATVQWDDEGVVPESFSLVKDGVLVDFQTTRAQASWLAPYYAKRREPVRSHGCAASEDAFVTPLQMLPNLTLEPGKQDVRLEELVADVQSGILITDGHLAGVYQGRSGLIASGGTVGPTTMREIRNGRLGAKVIGGAAQFDAIDLWKHVMAVAGPMTTKVAAAPWYTQENIEYPSYLRGGHGDDKGQPSQTTGSSIQAVAAIIANQPVIDEARKA